MDEFEGRAALVTGGGSGIGRGIALVLAGEGMNVAVTDVDEGSAEGVRDELRALGVESLAMAADVTAPSSLDDCAEAVRRQFGGLHLLASNAGVVNAVELADATEEDWEWVIQVNLLGLVRSLRAFLPLLRDSEGERHIVNTASMAGLASVAGLGIGIYTVSKYAAVAFSEQLRSELAPEGIGVSVLCPGMVRTPLGETSARNRPERYGGLITDPPPTFPEELEADMIEPEAVGRILVEGVRANRLHILTHPHGRPLVEQRFQGLMADFDAAENYVRRAARANGES